MNITRSPQPLRLVAVIATLMLAILGVFGLVRTADAAVSIFFDQCANTSGGVGPCTWTNGNAGIGNGWYENDSLMQRLVLGGLDAGTHVLKFNYQTTKSGKIAYDYLTSPYFSEGWFTQSQLCQGEPTVKFPNCATQAPSQFTIPLDPNIAANGVSQPANEKWLTWGATVTGWSYGSAADGQGTYYPLTGDTNRFFYLTFDVPGPCDGRTGCSVFMAWGAHVSSEMDWGAGASGSSISGSPYHMRVLAIDGAPTGNKDNQTSVNSLPDIGTLRVVKDLIPNNDTGKFNLLINGTTYATAVGDGGATPVQTFASGVNYTISETGANSTNLANYQKTIICRDGKGTVLAQTTTNSSSLSVPLAKQANVTCTIYNVLPPGEMVVLKEPNPTSVPAAGGNVAYAITVRNIGKQQLTLTSLNDDKFGNLNGKGTCSVPQTIAVSGSYTCSFTEFISGTGNTDHDNIVTAGGLDSNSDPISATDSASVRITGDPAIIVNKSATPDTLQAPGGEVIYSVVITNSGTGDVTISSLTDDKFGNITAVQGSINWTSCTVPRTIAEGGRIACAFSAEVTGTSGSTHTNIVTASGTGPSSVPVSGNGSADVVFGSVAAPLMSKTPGDTHVISGENVAFTVVMTNNLAGNITLNTLTDDVYGNVTSVQGDVKATTCSMPQTIAPSATYTCIFTATVTGLPGIEHVNTVATTGKDASNNDIGNSASAAVQLLAPPSLDMTKTPNPTHVLAPSGSVGYTIVVTNTGNLTATLDSLVDDKFGDITSVQGEITATDCAVPQTIGSELKYTCTFTATVAGAAGVTHTNVVTATATDPNGYKAIITDTASVDIAAASLAMLKTADVTQITAPSASVKYTVIVTNTSPVSVTISSLVDDKFGNITSVQGDITDTDCSVPQGVDVDLSYTCAFTATVSGVPGDTHTNVITATASNALVLAEPITTTDTADVIIEAPVPSLTMTKTADVSSIVAPSDSVQYTVVITNDGNITVTLDTLTDDMFGNITTVQGDITAETCAVPQTLSAAESYSCTFTATVSGNPNDTHTNVITADATDFFSTAISTTGTADVDIEAPVPSLTMTKTADVSSIVAPSDSVQYTVVITNDGPVTVTLDSLTDDMFGDITSVQGDITATDCAVPQDLDPDESYSCAFTATVSGAPAETHTNVITVDGTDFYKTPVSTSGSADVLILSPDSSISMRKTPSVSSIFSGASVTYQVVVTNTGAVTVTVSSLTDNKFGNITTKQGSITAENCAVPQTLAPAATYSCSFTATVTGSGGSTHTNVITASGTDMFSQPVSTTASAAVSILVLTACPNDSGVYARTLILGAGMGSHAGAKPLVAVSIPNPSNVLSLYGQLVGKETSAYNGVARFTPAKGNIQSHIFVTEMTSPAEQQNAEFWYGAELTPTNANLWKASLVKGNSYPHQPRAFVLYPTYGQRVQYWNYSTLIEGSGTVFWAPGWTPVRSRTVLLPGPLPYSRDIVVRVAAVDNDKDSRPIRVTVRTLSGSPDRGSGVPGVTLTQMPTKPTNGPLLNIMHFFLNDVPAGTTAIELEWAAEAPNGDSFTVTGFAINYPCGGAVK